jgi:hypothetical protein
MGKKKRREKKAHRSKARVGVVVRLRRVLGTTAVTVCTAVTWAGLLDVNQVCASGAAPAITQEAKQDGEEEED